MDPGVPPQKITEKPQVLSSPFAPSVVDLLTHQPPLPKQDNSNNWKKALIINSIFFSLGIGGLLFGFYSFHRLKSVEMQLQIKEIELERTVNDKIVSPTTAPVNNQLGAPTPTTGSVQGIFDSLIDTKHYVAKQTACFTIYIPHNNTAGTDDNCELIYDATIDNNAGYGISIQAEYQYFSSLDEMVKIATNNFSNSYKTDPPTTIDGAPANRVIEFLPNGDKLVHVYIFIPNRYNVGGLMVSGFEITKNLTRDQEEKQLVVFNQLLANWKWR